MVIIIMLVVIGNISGPKEVRVRGLGTGQCTACK